MWLSFSKKLFASTSFLSFLPNQTTMLFNDEKDENFLGLDLDYLATTPLDLLNLNKWALLMNNKIDTTIRSS